jgi:type II secretory pathway pseudopilin PulG
VQRSLGDAQGWEKNAPPGQFSGCRAILPRPIRLHILRLPAREAILRIDARRAFYLRSIRGPQMPSTSRKAGFTYIELIVIIIVIGIALGILVPYIQWSREKARREACINNMKQLGLGMHNYHDSHKRFPGSADLIGSGPVKQAGGWSFLLPVTSTVMYEYGTDAFGKLLAAAVDDPISSTDKDVIAVRNTQVPELICPSNPNRQFQDPVNKLNAFTNYKGMGATSAESLMCCADPNAPPPYGNAAHPISQPDGALFPGKGLGFRHFVDGTAKTIMAVETIDDSSSVWLAGSDATLVGMPKLAMTAPAETGNGYPFWHPTGFNGQYGGNASPAIKSLRTYLAYDFSPGSKDAGSYPAGVGRTPKYGPSSGHPGVVNHLFGDGAVRTIAKDVDFAMYFFVVTRNNSDPSLCPED